MHYIGVVQVSTEKDVDM